MRCNTKVGLQPTDHQLIHSNLHIFKPMLHQEVRDYPINLRTSNARHQQLDHPHTAVHHLPIHPGPYPSTNLPSVSSPPERRKPSRTPQPYPQMSRSSTPTSKVPQSERQPASTTPKLNPSAEKLSVPRRWRSRRAYLQDRISSIRKRIRQGGLACLGGLWRVRCRIGILISRRRL